MYNTDFQPQLDTFANDLFGVSYRTTRGRYPEAHERYHLPADVKLLPCRENEHGEWVPAPESSDIEKSVDSE